MNTKTKLGWISAKHFTAGVVVENNYIVETAPILKYMMGWSVLHLKDYINRRGWKFEWLKNKSSV
jgi:hypothetical protein